MRTVVVLILVGVGVGVGVEELEERLDCGLSGLEVGIPGGVVVRVHVGEFNLEEDVEASLELGHTGG